jgi:hypothetical protein
MDSPAKNSPMMRAFRERDWKRATVNTAIATLIKIATHTGEAQRIDLAMPDSALCAPSGENRTNRAMANAREDSTIRKRT